jgi:hypothetical protein
MDSMSFILKTALISSTLVPCHAPHNGLTVYASAPLGVPITDWPQQQEQPEIPHLPHEELSLRVTVDSGASGIYTNSSARSMHTSCSSQLAWLRNELGDKLIVISKDDCLGETFFSEAPPNPKLSVRAQTKPLAVVSRRMPARTRSCC